MLMPTSPTGSSTVVCHNVPTEPSTDAPKSEKKEKPKKDKGGKGGGGGGNKPPAEELPVHVGR